MRAKHNLIFLLIIIFVIALADKQLTRNTPFPSGYKQARVLSALQTSRRAHRIKKTSQTASWNTLKKEIQTIAASSTFLSYEHYNRFMRDLDAIGHYNTISPDDLMSARATIEKLNPYTRDAEDARRAQNTIAISNTISVNTPSHQCISDPAPVFTYDITDLSRIANITRPGVITTGNILKSHSYIWIADGGSVPIYAPVDSILISGVYVSAPEQGTMDFGLIFRISCEVEYRFGHFTDPLPFIRLAFPSEPKINDSRDNQITPIPVKAGDLLGYTSGTPKAHNFDFGVYNSAKPDLDATIAIATDKDKRANCPYDYFIPKLKNRYRNLLSNDFGAGGTVSVKYCD